MTRGVRLDPDVARRGIELVHAGAFLRGAARELDSEVDERGPSALVIGADLLVDEPDASRASRAHGVHRMVSLGGSSPGDLSNRKSEWVVQGPGGKMAEVAGSQAPRTT